MLIPKRVRPESAAVPAAPPSAGGSPVARINSPRRPDGGPSNYALPCAFLRRRKAGLSNSSANPAASPLADSREFILRDE